MEIDDGINVTSIIDDDVDCPVVCDAVWHTLTCEPDGAAIRTASAAARALADTLHAGGSQADGSCFCLSLLLVAFVVDFNAV